MITSINDLINPKLKTYLFSYNAVPWDEDDEPTEIVVARGYTCPSLRTVKSLIQKEYQLDASDWKREDEYGVSLYANTERNLETPANITIHAVWMSPDIKCFEE